VQDGARLEGDDGLTLVEVLLASVILATVVLGLVTGIMTAVSASDLHRREARSEVALRQYIEGLETGAYIPCPTAAPASFAPMTIDGYQLSVVAVDKWVTDSNPAAFATGCASPDSGVERLTVRLVDPAGKVNQDVNVVVRSSS
jgi:Tfp pilus assembly protein PilV